MRESENPEIRNSKMFGNKNKIRFYLIFSNFISKSQIIQTHFLILFASKFTY